MKKFVFILLTTVLILNIFADKLYDTRTGRYIDLDEARKIIKKFDVIYVGEIHDQKPYHDAQLNIIRLLSDENISVGMEYFNRRYNNVLKDYFQYNRFSNDEFLTRSNYYKTWGFDLSLYQDIFDELYKDNIPGFGINLDRSIVSKVARGGLETLSTEERIQLPYLHLNDFPAHKKYIKEVFTHMGMKMRFSPEMFNNFYTAQTIWEDTMAHSVWARMKENPKEKIVVLVGQGHLVYRFGIPERVKMRKKHAYCTIISVYKDELSKENMSVKYADYLYVLDAVKSEK